MYSNKTLVSVLIPCLSTCVFLRDSVQCVLDQTYKNIEILIAADDAISFALIKSTYAHPNIRVISANSHGDIGVARNKAIDAAKGDFFMLLDADDTIPPDYVEKLLVVALKNGVSVANTHYVDMPQQRIVRIPPMNNKFLSLNGFSRLLASIHPLVHRNAEPGFTEDFASDVIRDGLIISKFISIEVVNTFYTIRLWDGGPTNAGIDAELDIQCAYNQRIQQILFQPTVIGTHILSVEDTLIFADLFRFRAYVSNLFANSSVPFYNTFVSGKENQLWDQFQLQLAIPNGDLPLQKHRQLLHVEI